MELGWAGRQAFEIDASGQAVVANNHWLWTFVYQTLTAPGSPNAPTPLDLYRMSAFWGILGFFFWIF